MISRDLAAGLLTIHVRLLLVCACMTVPTETKDNSESVAQVDNNDQELATA